MYKLANFIIIAIFVVFASCNESQKEDFDFISLEKNMEREVEMEGEYFFSISTDHKIFTLTSEQREWVDTYLLYSKNVTKSAKRSNGVPPFPGPYPDGHDTGDDDSGVVVLCIANGSGGQDCYGVHGTDDCDDERLNCNEGCECHEVDP